MDKTQLHNLILRTIDIPSIPPVAAKVLQLAQSNISTINELTRIISEDYAFATRILKTANSPYFGRSREIHDIHTAIMVIGFSTMKSLVIASATKDLYKTADNYIIDLWSHHLAVAIASALLAKKTGLLSPEEAHILGLVHDIGSNVMHNNHPLRYLKTISSAFEQKASVIESEVTEFGFDHCDVGLLLAQKWHLPDNMNFTIGYHHPEKFAQATLSAYQRAICNLIAVADYICFELDIGSETPSKDIQACLSFISLDTASLEAIKKEVYTQYTLEAKEITS